MQIPILNGIYSDDSPDFRTSYPKNLIPVPKTTGISAGYLRPADGIEILGTGAAVDRGGINWDGILYRVMGSKLVSVDSSGAITTLGDVGGTTEQVTLNYSFDRLGIASNNNLFYWDKSTLTQVTDSDLLDVIDMIWVDGYFMTTDGEFIVVTELSDPTSVDPLKYGSSEASPDPIKALLKLRNEVYALNRYTIEVFDNIGGTGFPFQRIEGAQIDRGIIGTHACAVFLDTIAFLGSAREEAPAIWLGNNSTTVKISTREIDQLLLNYTETQLESVVLETRVDKSHRFLYIHLPDRTLLYDGASSRVLNTPVWAVLSSSLTAFSQYKAKNFVYVYDKWICADPTSFKLGTVTDSISSHYGNDVEWQFGTSIIYNNSNNALFYELELVSLTGRVELGTTPTMSTQYSVDGVNWSQPRTIEVGTIGNRLKRLVWFHQGHIENFRLQRFRGTSEAHLSFARLEAQIESLNA